MLGKVTATFVEFCFAQILQDISRHLTFAQLRVKLQVKQRVVRRSGLVNKTKLSLTAPRSFLKVSVRHLVALYTAALYPGFSDALSTL